MSSVAVVGNKGLALWEVVSVITSCIMAEWTVAPFAAGRGFVTAFLILLALAFMIFSHWYRGEGLRALGFRLDNFVAVSGDVFLPLPWGLLFILFLSWALKPHGFFS